DTPRVRMREAAGSTSMGDGAGGTGTFGRLVAAGSRDARPKVSLGPAPGCLGGSPVGTLPPPDVGPVVVGEGDFGGGTRVTEGSLGGVTEILGGGGTRSAALVGPTSKARARHDQPIIGKFSMRARSRKTWSFWPDGSISSARMIGTLARATDR